MRSFSIMASSIWRHGVESPVQVRSLCATASCTEIHRVGPGEYHSTVRIHYQTDIHPFGAATPDATEEVLKKRAGPYTKIMAELPQMRRATVQALSEMLRT